MQKCKVKLFSNFTIAQRYLHNHVTFAKSQVTPINSHRVHIQPQTINLNQQQKKKNSNICKKITEQHPQEMQEDTTKLIIIAKKSLLESYNSKH